MRRALITGVSGQDGSFLAEYLRNLGYAVFGLIRRPPDSCPWFRFEPALPGVCPEFIYGDLRDELSIEMAVQRSWPDEIYNLAGQTFVPTSWECPDGTFEVNAAGFIRLLKIVARIKPDTRVFQATSSEIFGDQPIACNELSPLTPVSPYGISKLAAHHACSAYRRKGIFVASGIMFNHESERRGVEIVTRKVSLAVAEFAARGSAQLTLGSLDVSRDWGFAGEYVKVIHQMLQLSDPVDLVIGTGETHSLREFIEECCAAAGILTEDFISRVLRLDARHVRAGQINHSCSDPLKVKDVLGWTYPYKLSFLATRMVSADLERLGRIPLVKAA